MARDLAPRSAQCGSAAVSLSAVQPGILLSGSIVIESVFAINGMGRLAWESPLRSDLPVVQAIILILSLI